MGGEIQGDREAMAAELAWLEGLLEESEDWRALKQLEAREVRGEGITSIDGPRLKTALLDGLAANRFFKRRRIVLDEMVRAPSELNSAAAGGPLAAPAPANSPADDLSKIRGVNAVLARRLHALDVRSFDQIGEWSAADVAYVSKTLGLGRAISSENWIEQAALLARARPRPAPEPTPETTPEPIQSRADEPQQKVATAAVLFEPEPTVEAKQDSGEAEGDETTALIPAGPLPAWHYAQGPSHPQHSPMTIADALAVLGMLHKTAVDESYAADRAANRDVSDRTKVATPEPPELDKTPQLNPAGPLPAWQYRTRTEDVIVSEPAARVAAMAATPSSPAVHPAPAFPASASHDAQSESPIAVVVPSVIALPPPPAPMPVSRYPAIIARPAVPAADSDPGPRSLSPPAKPADPLPASTAVAEPPRPLLPAVVDALNHAVAAATRPVAPPQTAAWAEDAEREVRAIERLLAKSAPVDAPSVRSSTQAHVTIRRAEAGMPAAARQLSGSKEGGVASIAVRDPNQSARFDGANYAAYRDRIEEASVEIVRQPSGGGAMTFELPGESQVGANARIRMMGSRVGQFLKALTGR